MRSMKGQSNSNEKINDASHYMATHQGSENVDMDAKDMPLIHSKADSCGNRIITVMHNSGYTSQQISRQVSIATKGQTSGESATWSEELLSSGIGISSELTGEERLAAALVAVHFAQGRPVGLQDVNNINKVPPDRNEVEASPNLLESQMRLFPQSQQQLVVEVPPLATLSPLKRAQDHVWFQSKHAEIDEIPFKNETIMNSVALDNCELDTAVPNKSHKKSLPHKKRISRRLRRSTPLPTAAARVGGATVATSRAAAATHMLLVECPQQDDQILPDNFVEVQSVEDNTLTHQMRPSFICQICGDFYDMDQLRFYQHLKQHYEPQAPVMIANSIAQTHSSNTSLVLDEMNTIVDNSELAVAQSLEGTAPAKAVVYRPAETQILYSSNDNGEGLDHTQLPRPQHALDGAKEDLYQPALYSCLGCTKTFRKQKACEAHYKEFHTKVEDVDDMSEFSEPEDLMEGIHVIVETDEDYHEASEMPHLTVENGHVHQGHLIMKQWFTRNSEVQNTDTLAPQPGAHQSESAMSAGGQGAGEADALLCPLCSRLLPGREDYEQHANTCHIHFKEDVLQRMMAVEEEGAGQLSADSHHAHSDQTNTDAKVSQVSHEPGAGAAAAVDKKASHKKLVCAVAECRREFRYRNSLLYHALSHSGHRPFSCGDCDKSFYTTGALKVHSRLHSGDKPYKCEECGRDFRQWGDLKYHKASLHSTQKLHQCDYCGKEFARKYSLNVHRRIHTGEKNYKCEYCDKTFRASSYLMFHRRIHTGEKPHACDHCAKSFRVKGDLRRHVLTHNKIKPNSDNTKKRVNKNMPTVKKENEQTEQKECKTNAVNCNTSGTHRGELLLITNDQACEGSDNSHGATGRPEQDPLKVTNNMYMWSY